jgi:hypothetical protein
MQQIDTFFVDQESTARRDRLSLRRRTGRPYEVIASGNGRRFKARPADPVPSTMHLGPRWGDAPDAEALLRARGWRFTVFAPCAEYPLSGDALASCLPHDVTGVTCDLHGIATAIDGCGEVRRFACQRTLIGTLPLCDWCPYEIGCPGFDELVALIRTALADLRSVFVGSVVQRVIREQGADERISVALIHATEPLLAHGCVPPPQTWGINVLPLKTGTARGLRP